MTVESARLQIVAGKGGVGRSTVAAALAASAADAGERVLAVDATGSGGLQQVVDGARLRGRFDTLALTTRSALDDYLRIHLRLPLAPSRLGPLARIFDYVAAAAPGVRELLVIGKIGWEARHGPWDRIVVDAPATGHVVEMMTAPEVMAELVPTGPLAAQTAWLSEVVAAPSSEVVLVTIPEELPVTETGELLARLRAETATSVTTLVVNKMPVGLSEGGRREAEHLIETGSPLAPVADLAWARHRLAAEQLTRLSGLELATIAAEDRASAPFDAVREAIERGAGDDGLIAELPVTPSIPTPRSAPAVPAPPCGDGDAVERALADAQVLVMTGPGGVGKTTIGAALGLRAAQVHDRRVVVVTVDPARRLAEAFGVAQLTEEPVLVPVGTGAGRLWMLMVDMAKSWDELVVQHAPDAEISERLLANGLYRTLTRRFVQSHDYIALDHLLSLTDRDRYDLVIVDTPPSGHALDLLDAPGRMIDFFESRLLRLLTFGAGSGLSAVAAKPFLLVAERLLGSDFLAQITEFFTLFAELRPAFVARAEAVAARLADPATDFVVVTTTDPVAVAGSQELVDELGSRRLEAGLVLVNRFAPTLELDAVGKPPTYRLRPGFERDDLATLDDETLAAACHQLLNQAVTAELPRPPAGCPVVAIRWSPADLADLDALAGLVDDL